MPSEVESKVSAAQEGVKALLEDAPVLVAKSGFQQCVRDQLGMLLEEPK